VAGPQGGARQLVPGHLRRRRLGRWRAGGARQGAPRPSLRLAAFGMSPYACLSRMALLSCDWSPLESAGTAILDPFSGKRPATPSRPAAGTPGLTAHAVLPDLCAVYGLDISGQLLASEKKLLFLAGPRQGLPAREDEEEARHVPRRRHRQRRQLVQVRQRRRRVGCGAAAPASGERAAAPACIEQQCLPEPRPVGLYLPWLVAHKGKRLSLGRARSGTTAAAACRSLPCSASG
jgi:hypothetical protein